MAAIEIRTSRVAFHGRVADELTRQDLAPGRYRASLRNGRRAAVQKADGSFAFADLAPSPPDHAVRLAGREFRTRDFDVSWPGGAPQEVAFPGEDELQVIVTRVTGRRVSFATIPFLPTIPAGSEVIGESGFTTALDEDLEGVDVDGAALQATGTIAPGHALRIVRSRRLLLRPGPYYEFPPGSTVAAFRVVEDTAGDPPVADARIRITAVNGAAVTSVTVGGVELFRANLPGPPPPPPSPPTPFLLGTDAARTGLTNERGDAVFYYPSNTPVTSLTVSVERDGYQTQTRTIAVVPQQRTFDQVRLVRS
ncbi:MAG TPA: hypothetical protein VF212_12015 [Longimicrobiales bacterium]